MSLGWPKHTRLLAADHESTEPAKSQLSPEVNRVTEQANSDVLMVMELNTTSSACTTPHKTSISNCENRQQQHKVAGRQQQQKEQT